MSETTGRKTAEDVLDETIEYIEIDNVDVPSQDSILKAMQDFANQECSLLREEKDREIADLKAKLDKAVNLPTKEQLIKLLYDCANIQRLENGHIKMEREFEKEATAIIEFLSTLK